MARKTHTGRFYVTADDKNRTFETEGGAISLAVTFAQRATEDHAFYVREGVEQGIVATVARIGKTVVTTRRARR